MTTREMPTYSSFRIQRATMINGIEAARLQKRLQFIEGEKLHQYRLTNQNIRLLSVSLDYIQSCSGHSPEAWSAEFKPEERFQQEVQGQCFLYGVRIWSRKKKRLNRTSSAFERWAAQGGDCVAGTESGTLQSTPQPVLNTGGNTVVNLDNKLDATATKGADFQYDKVSAMKSGIPSRHDWEDNTSEVTKKILNNQGRWNSLQSHSLYQWPGDFFNTQSSKNARSLIRKIRISANPISSFEGFPVCPVHVIPSGKSQPASDSVHPLERRATVGNILNQRQPSIQPWHIHLRQISAPPLPVSTRRKLFLSARKELNVRQRAQVSEKVKDLIKHAVV